MQGNSVVTGRAGKQTGSVRVWGTKPTTGRFACGQGWQFVEQAVQAWWGGCAWVHACAHTPRRACAAGTPPETWKGKESRVPPPLAHATIPLAPCGAGCSLALGAVARFPAPSFPASAALARSLGPGAPGSPVRWREPSCMLRESLPSIEPGWRRAAWGHPGKLVEKLRSQHRGSELLCSWRRQPISLLRWLARGLAAARSSQHSFPH